MYLSCWQTHYCIHFCLLGSLLSKDEIHANLRNIVDRSSFENGTSCGILTAEDRDHWASLREKLSSNKNNSEVLRKIDGALFVLCLDDRKYADEYEAMKMFLHGDGNNRLVTHLLSLH